MVESGSNRKERDLKRLDRVKLGDVLNYHGHEGQVVGRYGSNMIKIADNETHEVQTIPISETYFKSDIIGDGNIKAQMWDLMARDQRSALLSKSGILEESHKAYLYRDWDSMPEQVQDVLKEISGETPHGGVAGREPTFNDRNDESASFRDVTDSSRKHVTAPYEDKAAPAFSKDKSDVEHGAYGGVITDTEIDATDEYEDDRPKKPLSGAQTEANEGPSGQTGTKRDVKDEPKNPKDGKGVHDRWSENRKGDQNLAGITGEPNDDNENPKNKDEDSGVGQASGGWQGSKPNAQAAEKDGKQQQAAITGKPDLAKLHDEDVEWGKEEKKDDKEHGQGPTHMDKMNIVNKHNTRWGIRQASQEDIQRMFYEK